MRIFAIDKKTRHKKEIKDLYWFEENQVHSFEDERYKFEFTGDNTLEFKVIVELSKDSDIEAEDIIRTIEQLVDEFADDSGIESVSATQIIDGEETNEKS